MRTDRGRVGAPPFLARLLLVGVRLAAAVTELWLTFAWIAGLLPHVQLLALHVAAVGMFVVAVGLARRDLAGGLLIDGLLLLLTGPLAAVEMLFRWPRRATFTTVVRPEPVTPSASEALHADIAADRRVRRDPGGSRGLMERIKSGDLASQQFAIEVIARHYRPDMHPMLLAALSSPVPALRVQAAAVFAQLRERHAAEAKDLLRPKQPPDRAAEIRREVTACRNLAQSPFLDEALRAALMARAGERETLLAPEVIPLTSQTEPVVDVVDPEPEAGSKEMAPSSAARPRRRTRTAPTKRLA